MKPAPGASSSEMSAIYDDISAVQEGDKCSCCGGTLTYTKGIGLDIFSN